MAYQLEVNIVHAIGSDTWFGHMFVNLNDSNGERLASYGFNPEGGYLKALSPFVFPLPAGDPDGIHGVPAFIQPETITPHESYRFDISDAQYVNAIAYANEIDARDYPKGSASHLISQDHHATPPTH